MTFTSTDTQSSFRSYTSSISSAVLRRLIVGAAAAAVAATLAACCSATPTAPVAAAPTATPVVLAEPTPSVITSTVDQTFWHSGFEVRLGRATLIPSTSGGVLTVEAAITNNGPGSRSFDGVALALGAGGSIAPVDDQETDLSPIPGGETASGTLAFRVDHGFDLSVAVLTVGSADGNQAVVPLGPNGTVVANAPLDVPAAARPGRAGSVRVVITGGVVRLDDPLSPRQPGTGHAIVDLTIDVHRVGGANPTTFIGTDNLALQLPDGTTVAVRPDGVSNPGELLAPGATVRDLHVRFEVPEITDGRYVLRVTSLTPDPHHSTVSIPFTVEPR